MRLNHLDLAVPDLPAARAFFVDLLGFRHRETLGRDGLAILEDDSGLVLVLSRLRRQGPATYPEGFHVGFLLEGRAAVDALHQRLTAAGVEVLGPPAEMRGRWLFYCHAPGGILVEVAHRP
jgi:catechol 2,3-dioxygenase-like lactoylglutathione lyase family enzyme